MRLPVITMLAAISFTSFAISAEPLSRAEIDSRTKATARQTIEMGVELFNSGNHEGCYRLYQGSLMAMNMMLDHRPETMKMIKEKMAKADGMPAVSQKAFALREALDELLNLTSMKKPLWDRLGGQPAVEAVIGDFVVAAATDPKVNFFRDGAFKLDDAGVKRLNKLLVELVSATTGGPLKYTGRDMKSSHKGMRITEAEFNALAGHLIATLKKYKVPQAEIDELVGIVASTKGDIVEVKK